ncbi:EAL domain-containing protein [Caenispirillum bisanense]|uniref:EAL domain, c-di-GMP-specific phosphodiesterase class I (Or its enzymatically inactive variant) n=1 Tax=Caenispirillum bisanense TaxID=414052 RepID=A0A286GEE5_9PROT|nr:EAL domain-containing protein [Caenispirillum bisanense]SOD93868.1 EAL domain, c-di-GMP-specific phosphodiesterase class I (or its enzymatically inactive variant) [Caenispirillum bisanense]
MSQDAEIERLRAQRSRFIAFAFAGNDVLLELDSDGCVSYCAGTVEAMFGRAPKDLKGTPVHDLVSDRDMLMLDELMVRLRRTARLDRIPLHFQGPEGDQRLSLSAILLPETPDVTYLTLTHLRGPAALAPAPLVKTPVAVDSFAAKVKDKIRSGEVDDPQLTLLDLTPDKLAEALPAERAEQFMDSVMDYLRAWSVGGDGVGRLDNGSLGVLHDGSLNQDDISKKVNDMLTVFDPGAKPIDIKAATVEVDGRDLSDEDLSKALVYTMNNFVRGEAIGTDFGSITAGYKAAMEETLGKVATFRRAVGQNLTLVFQPIVDLSTWQVHHYEALARLDSGDRLIAPARLIGFAEEFGVVEEMDMAVMKKALGILTDNRGIRSGAKIAINLSGRSVVNDRFCAELLLLLQKSEHLLPRMLFEVTESHEMTDLARANQILRRLRHMGCAVCIDDFGAGAAAFPYLKALEVDYVKIDGSYIRDAFHTRHGRPFLRAIAGLARDLGMQCIGEMVEDSDTMWLLRELGIGYGQGWFFGKPAADVSRFTLTGQPGRSSQRVVTAS